MYKKILSLVLVISMLTVLSVGAFANEVAPCGNLASIYQSEKPFWGSAVDYRTLTSEQSYKVSDVEALYEKTRNMFIAVLTAACPPLGAVAGSIAAASDWIDALYDYVTDNQIDELYVRIQCYEPKEQPTPDEVLYSKYVVDYFTDAALETRIGSMRNVYYQKLVYRLNG